MYCQATLLSQSSEQRSDLVNSTKEIQQEKKGREYQIIKKKGLKGKEIDKE